MEIQTNQRLEVENICCINTNESEEEWESVRCFRCGGYSLYQYKRIRGGTEKCPLAVSIQAIKNSSWKLGAMCESEKKVRIAELCSHKSRDWLALYTVKFYSSLYSLQLVQYGSESLVLIQRHRRLVPYSFGSLLFLLTPTLTWLDTSTSAHRRRPLPVSFVLIQRIFSTP